MTYFMAHSAAACGLFLRAFI